MAFGLHASDGSYRVTPVSGLDSSGSSLPEGFDNLTTTFTYNGSDLSTQTRTNGVNTWTQTFSYTDGNLTSISAWVKS